MTMITKNADGTFTLGADFAMSTTIAKRAGGTVLEFAAGQFPAEAIAKMLRYGATRIFNDRVGGSDTDAETKVALARDMIDSFKKGVVGRIARESVDPIVREARRLVMSNLKAKRPDDHKKLRAMDDDDREDKLDEIIAANPTVMEHAEKMVKAKIAALDFGDVTI